MTTKKWNEPKGEGNILSKSDEDKIRKSPSFQRTFFQLRFSRDPEADPTYYREWVDRLNSDHPTRHMDNQTFSVYQKLLKTYR